MIGQKLHTVIGALAGGGVQGRVQCFVGGGIFIASMGCSPRRMVFAWPIPAATIRGLGAIVVADDAVLIEECALWR